MTPTAPLRPQRPIARRLAAAFGPLLVVLALSAAGDARSDTPPASHPETRPAHRAHPDAADGRRPGVVRVALLQTDAMDEPPDCVGTDFLAVASFATGIRVDPGFTPVRLRDERVFDHPLAFFSGSGDFELTEHERRSLRAYLLNGGFVIASASCSNRAWARSFRQALDRLISGAELREIPLEHDALQMIFEVASLERRGRSGEASLWGLEIEGRLALVFAPDGLDDTRNAGNGCCCCGGSELRDAKHVNANLLAYALTR